MKQVNCQIFLDSKSSFFATPLMGRVGFEPTLVDNATAGVQSAFFGLWLSLDRLYY